MHKNAPPWGLHLGGVSYLDLVACDDTQERASYRHRDDIRTHQFYILVPKLSCPPAHLMTIKKAGRRRVAQAERLGTRRMAELLLATMFMWDSCSH